MLPARQVFLEVEAEACSRLRATNGLQPPRFNRRPLPQNATLVLMLLWLLPRTMKICL